MKKLLLASTLLSICETALAADLAVKAPPPAPPPFVVPIPYFTWTGCYLGGHLGGGWARKDFSDPSGHDNFAPDGESVEVKPNGFLSGGQIGCNYQFATNWVAGIDGDFSWADVKGNTIDPYFTNKNFHSKTDFLATATGRLGFAWDRWMVYGKGGVAWADDKYNLISGSTDASVGEHRTGWTAGVGVEWAFWDNWSVKVEYDHYGFGSRRVVFATGGYVTNIPADVDQRIDVVKAGINYRFNWGAPPPGRY